MSTSTAIPTTLHEYQDFVRKEALSIQQDMGWPDDKLNAALKALGLPEKLTFRVPVEVTGKMFALIRVDDATSEEEAREQIKGMDSAALKSKLDTLVNTGYFGEFEGQIVEMPTTFEVGGLDITHSNPSVANADPAQRLCEQYDPTDRWYCTRPRGHEGVHARGNGRTLNAVWPNA